MAISLVGTPNTADSGTGGATSLTVNVPTGVTDGDLLLWTMSGASATIPATPTGWTLWDSRTITAAHQAIWYRVASSEPASYTSSGMTSSRYVSVMYAFNGVDATTPKDTAVVAATSTSTSVQPPSITTVTANAWVVAVEQVSVAAATTGSWTTSNMTLGTSTSTNNAGAPNVVVGTGYTTQATAGAFAPAWTLATGTALRGIATSSALRPAATAAAASRPIVVFGQAVNRAGMF